MISNELIEGKRGARGVLTLTYNVSRTSATCAAAFLEELYKGSSESVRGASKRLLDGKQMGELYKISFSFEASEEGKIISTLGRIKIVFGKDVLLENTRRSQLLIVDNKFIKPLKNSKKQRFIPSRNEKKCKNQ